MVEGNIEASAENLLSGCRLSLLELSRFGVDKKAPTPIQHDGSSSKNLTLRPKMEVQFPIMAELSPLTINYFKDFVFLLWHVEIPNLATSLSSTNEKRGVQNGCRCNCDSIKLSWGPHVNIHRLKSAR